MILAVDGHNLTRFVKHGQYAVTRFDIEGRNAGETMDTAYHRDYRGYKRRVSVGFTALDKSEWDFIEHTVLRGKEFVTVHFEDFGVMASAVMWHSAFEGRISTALGARVGARVVFEERRRYVV